MSLLYNSVLFKFFFNMNSNPDVSFSEQSTSKDKVLAIINLDLGSGNEVLVIKKGQDLRQLAQEICFKNQIDS